MNLSLILFLTGIFGFVLNRKNIILMLISIEMVLLVIRFLKNILATSFNFDDILGQIYVIYIIAIAGIESVIGLGILIAFYRLRGSVAIRIF